MKFLGLLPEIVFFSPVPVVVMPLVGELMMKPHIPVGSISRITQKSFQSLKRISYQAEYFAWVSMQGRMVMVHSRLDQVLLTVSEKWMFIAC